MTFTGICACGCGQPTTIAKASKPKHGEYFGYPQRYVHGHHTRGKVRDKSTRWKGGRRLSHGYWVIYLPGHPLAAKSGYVLEHRMIWAAAHKQSSIPTGQIIHHRDGNKTNNTIENLELMPFKMHQSMHAKIAAATPEHLERFRQMKLKKRDH